MQLWQIILTVILGMLSAVSFVISCFQAGERGPVFTNTYLLAAKEEREKINKKAEYRLARNVFLVLGVLFALVTLNVLTLWMWLFYAINGLAVVLVVYVVVRAIRDGDFK